MPSRADGRIAAERVARTVGLVALGALLWRRWEPPATAVATERVDSAAALPAVLARATAHPTGTLHVAAGIADRPARAWLAAIAGAGTNVTWSADSTSAPIAASAEALPAPDGRVRVTVRAPAATPIAIRDASGLVDTAVVSASGVRSIAGTLQGTVHASARGVAATVSSPDSIVVRPVLVLARAGWEGKFVVAALEEAGWRVDARFTVAPGALVAQGGAALIDTARYAAVVALDESASGSAAAIARFVRTGGGAIVAGEALTLAPLASVLPARAGASLSASLGALAGDAPRRALPAVALRPTTDDAVVLERREANAVAVAARVALGRVVALGYADTWRWRMQGGEGSDAAHRAWWSSLVSSVAYAPVVPRSDAAPDTALVTPRPPDPAPFASMVATLGPPSSTGASDRTIPPGRTDAILFALALLALLAEWGSRRTRGAR